VSTPERPVASRRALLQVGLGAVAATAAIATTVTKARAQEKIAQNLVMYQDHPKDDQECDNCINWVAPNQCKIIAGDISPKGWCGAYAPKG
jgi:High potential iron-sulfur protein